MKKILYITFLLVLCLIQNIQAQEKLAQTGFQFLSVISDARAAALAGSVTSLENQSSSLFFNPATMSLDTNFINVSFSLNNWIADIKHQNFSLSINPADGLYGVFGVSLQIVDYGEILGTVVSSSEKGYEDIGLIDASALALGLGYSKRISDKFSVGGQIKWVKQSLGESTIGTDPLNIEKVNNRISTLSFDFGTLYKTGFKSLAFGMSVRNFSPEVKYASEGFQLPLKFSMGISMNVLDFASADVQKYHSLILSIDAINASSHKGQVSFGVDYKFLNVFSLRGGYITNNHENKFAVGIGVSFIGFTFDYALTPYGVLGNINRFTFRYNL